MPIRFFRRTGPLADPSELRTLRQNSSDTIRLLEVKFHRSMKPEGVVAFSRGDERRLLVVDDGGGYAVLGYPKRDQ